MNDSDANASLFGLKYTILLPERGDLLLSKALGLVCVRKLEDAQLHRTVLCLCHLLLLGLPYAFCETVVEKVIHLVVLLQGLQSAFCETAVEKVLVVVVCFREMGHIGGGWER